MKKKPMTAAKLIAELQTDPDFVARQKVQEQKQTEGEEGFRREEAPLMGELLKLGYNVQSVWQLMEFYKDNYTKAIPLLLEHFNKPYHARIRQGIAYALGAKTAFSSIDYWSQLVELYKAEPLTEPGGKESTIKVALASSIANIADDKTMPALIELIKDKSNGPSRVMFLSALRRIQNRNDVKPLLLQLSSDPALTKELMAWNLGKTAD